MIRKLGLANDTSAFSFKSDTSTYKLTKTIPLENGPAKESLKCATTYAVRPRLTRMTGPKKNCVNWNCANLLEQDWNDFQTFEARAWNHMKLHEIT